MDPWLLLDRRANTMDRDPCADAVGRHQDREVVVRTGNVTIS